MLVRWNCLNCGARNVCSTGHITEENQLSEVKLCSDCKHPVALRLVLELGTEIRRSDEQALLDRAYRIMGVHMSCWRRGDNSLAWESKIVQYRKDRHSHKVQRFMQFRNFEMHFMLKPGSSPLALDDAIIEFIACGKRFALSDGAGFTPYDALWRLELSETSW